MDSKIVQLSDLYTSEEKPFYSKITEGGDNNIFHTHDFYEITYILEGSIEHEINGVRSKLYAGDIVFINPPDIHSFFRKLLARFHMNDLLREGLDVILEPFHFSRSYMCRAFHKYLNCTMTEYLNEIRLQQATYQLQYTDETVLSICHDVGFSSVSYFNNLFKKKHGMSPSSFRKERQINTDKENQYDGTLEK